MRAWPRSTVSLSAASLTVMSHSVFRRWAKAAVNFSGMCCTMTMPGQSTGMACSRVSRASVPPVDAPTTMTFSVVWTMALEAGLGSTASAVSFCVTFRVRGTYFCTLALAAALTSSQSMIRDSSMNCLVPTLGFWMTDTAPYSRAFMVVSAFFSVSVEQMMVGMGCWVMIFFRKVMPSMRGISTSRESTSGIWSRMISAAAKGSPAAAMTSISGSEE